MFFRIKQAGAYRYLQIAESFRDQGRVRQRVLATLGNLDQLAASGKVDALLASGAKCSEKLAVLDARQTGQLQPGHFTRIGPDAVFGRVWAALGIDAAIRTALQGRRFGFEVERAVYLTVMHRLFAAGSDRAGAQWRPAFRLPGCQELVLHQVYRAMGCLGSVLREQQGRTPFAPRCVKDWSEEELFGRRSDLFSRGTVVFFDTTTIYFEGHGGESLGQRGISKDSRPDLPQLVVAVVLDEAGMPLCCEMWPGNTTDVKPLLPVAARLRARFHVSAFCIIADRGMIAAATLQELEAPASPQPYILGVRMRAVKAVREAVLGRGGRYQVLEDGQGERDPLAVKEVWHEGRRYVVCRNEAQAARDRCARERIVASLRAQLGQGEKALVGNKGYRKYLRLNAPQAFAVDEEKIAAEARYDGKWVLTTNTQLPAAAVAQQYKRLWLVEDTFRTMKSILDTRPIFHRLDATIRGQVFCSFLALLMRRRLEEELRTAGHTFEWQDILRSLAEVQEAEAEFGGRRVVLRSEMAGCATHVFRAVGAPIPPAIRIEAPPGADQTGENVVPGPSPNSVTY